MTVSHSRSNAQRDGHVRLLVAPNAFKGSLTAARAAAAMARGVKVVLPGADVRLLPIADGGDGSVECLIDSGFARHSFDARGPTGSPGRGTLAFQGKTAVVEIANTCGMALLPNGVLEPLTSSTAGLGDAIVAALDLGAEEVVICLGGSASTDGGAGMLAALGAVARDDQGRDVVPTGATLGDIVELDLSGIDPRVRLTQFILAADVDSPLFGAEGAAAVFAPQKGADEATVARLDESLRSWGRVLTAASGHDVTEQPGAGAAGGSGASVLAVLRPTVIPGSSYFMDRLGVSAAVASSDLVVTGEGRVDEQSVLGKGSLAVVEVARAAGVGAAVVCGSSGLPPQALHALGVRALATILAEASGIDDAIGRAEELLALATSRAVAAATTGAT